jgi:hypothetical protein
VSRSHLSIVFILLASRPPRRPSVKPSCLGCATAPQPVGEEESVSFQFELPRISFSAKVLFPVSQVQPEIGDPTAPFSPKGLTIFKFEPNLKSKHSTIAQMMFPAVSAILALLAFVPRNVSAALGPVRSRAPLSKLALCHVGTRAAFC